ncbi:unnamed protein product [Dovyalis caffra]|uniref:NAC domain-containing protein n=1 Tax=Dovyalis caffra TaxID=77055 RepID=A0AAV1S1A7_9ROSI|nr:unnamed protein product [Dovyalis caffra]
MSNPQETNRLSSKNSTMEEPIPSNINPYKQTPPPPSQPHISNSMSSAPSSSSVPSINASPSSPTTLAAATSSVLGSGDLQLSQKHNDLLLAIKEFFDADPENLSENFKASPSTNISLQPPRTVTTTSVPAVHFDPTDEELMVNYLKKRIDKKNLPTNKFEEVDLYEKSPEILAADYKDSAYTKFSGGNNEWYFFTKVNKRPGNKVNRLVSGGDGYWQHGSYRKDIRDGIHVIGYRRTFTFYAKKKGCTEEKTNWRMHEFSLKDEDSTVLCRVFEKKENKPKNVRRQQRGGEQNDDAPNDQASTDGGRNGTDDPSESPKSI